MSGSGLPPLPKSLSNASLSAESSAPRKQHRKHESEGGMKLPPPPPAPRQPRQPPPPAPKQPPPPPPRKQSKLDVQLARLRKEMYSLRELDLSLLSQLWSLNEALQEFRAIQEMLSPSSDIDDDGVIYSNLPVVPPPPASSSIYPLSSSSSRSSNGFTTEL